MASTEQVYAAVAARRLGWDQLVWQVPTLSLTAQAFLFMLALDPGSTRFARAMASALSLTMSVLSVQLMSRHRQAEFADARWLEEREREEAEAHPDDRYVVHGLAFVARRDVVPAGPLGRLPGYWTWVVGLGLFGLAALTVLAVTALRPEWLAAS